MQHLVDLYKVQRDISAFLLHLPARYFITHYLTSSHEHNLIICWFVVLGVTHESFCARDEEVEATLSCSSKAFFIRDYLLPFMIVFKQHCHVCVLHKC